MAITSTKNSGGLDNLVDTVSDTGKFKERVIIYNAIVSDLFYDN